MVAAGVFLIARMSPLINAAPVAMEVITVIGGTTAFFAGTVGCVQNDIKRIVAYSTCSQLGYMFLGAGVGAYPVAIFHLIDQAIFKSLLFLAAGSVIHAMSDEQDIRLMGGLARKLPITTVTMLAGALALAAIPPFSGYYSKDAILDAAFATHTPAGIYGWLLGVITAGLTSFYIFRLFVLTFFGTSRVPKHLQAHVHETPLVMLGPLVVLAIGALSSGFSRSWRQMRPRASGVTVYRSTPAAINNAMSPMTSLGMSLVLVDSHRSSQHSRLANNRAEAHIASRRAHGPWMML